MSQQPSYLGTLNAIASGAARGEQILSAWQRATADPTLASVLEFLATRERAHAAAFAKRISELGYRAEERPSKRFKTHLELAGSQAPDLQKFEEILGYPASDTSDHRLLKIFTDTSIDPETGSLLGRYIAEDRDSTRRLRAQFERLGSATSEDDDAVLHDIATRLDRLTATLEELKSLRS